MKPENSKKQLKKLITSSELVAASSTTRVTEWAPHGTKTDLGFMSRSLEWTLFFFSFIFAPLSSDYPLLSSQQMLSCSSLFRLTIKSFFFQSCLCLNPKEEEYGATSETSIIPHYRLVSLFCGQSGCFSVGSTSGRYASPQFGCRSWDTACLWWGPKHWVTRLFLKIPPK